MASFNKVILMGNLTRDPELRVTPGGMSICKLGIAVNRVFTVQGEKREEVTYVDVDAFGKQADVISKFMSKGRPILIEGRLRLDEWEDRTSGQKRSKLGVVCENFQFVGSRGEGEGGANPGYSSGPPARSKPDTPDTESPAPAPGEDFDDNVPF